VHDFRFCMVSSVNLKSALIFLIHVKMSFSFVFYVDLLSLQETLDFGCI